jgi:hypothetical protein
MKQESSRLKEHFSKKVNLKLAKFTLPKETILYLQCNEQMTSAFKYWVNEVNEMN